MAKIDLSSISRSRRENGYRINCSKFHFCLCEESFKRKKAMSNWPIEKQTDNSAALDGRQSLLSAPPLFNDAIVSSLFRSKRTLFITLYITIIVWFHHSVSIKNVCNASKKWRVNTAFGRHRIVSNYP